MRTAVGAPRRPRAPAHRADRRPADPADARARGRPRGGVRRARAAADLPRARGESGRDEGREATRAAARRARAAERDHRRRQPAPGRRARAWSRRAGLEIGADLSLVGCDDVAITELFARRSPSSAATTADRPLAAELLLRRLRGGEDDAAQRGRDPDGVRAARELRAAGRRRPGLVHELAAAHVERRAGDVARRGRRRGRRTAPGHLVRAAAKRPSGICSGGSAARASGDMSSRQHRACRPRRGRRQLTRDAVGGRTCGRGRGSSRRRRPWSPRRRPSRRSRRSTSPATRSSRSARRGLRAHHARHRSGSGRTSRWQVHRLLQRPSPPRSRRRGRHAGGAPRRRAPGGRASRRAAPERSTARRARRSRRGPRTEPCDGRARRAPRDARRAAAASRSTATRCAPAAANACATARPIPGRAGDEHAAVLQAGRDAPRHAGTSVATGSSRPLRALRRPRRGSRPCGRRARRGSSSPRRAGPARSTRASTGP